MCLVNMYLLNMCLLNICLLNMRLLNIHRGLLITSCSRQLDTGWVNRLIDLIAVGIEAEYSVTEYCGHRLLITSKRICSMNLFSR